MNNERLHRLLLSLLFSMMITTPRPAEKYMRAGIGLPDWATAIAQPPDDTPTVKSAGPVTRGKTTSDSQQYNLFAEIMERRKIIPWETRVKVSIPASMCKVFEICSSDEGLPAKLYSFVPVNVEGQKIAKGVFVSWTQNPDQPDILILAHTTEHDGHFFQLASDGTLLKTAYIVKGRSLELVSNALVKPIFEKDKEEWHHWALTGNQPSGD